MAEFVLLNVAPFSYRLIEVESDNRGGWTLAIHDRGGGYVHLEDVATKTDAICEFMGIHGWTALFLEQEGGMYGTRNRHGHFEPFKDQSKFLDTLHTWLRATCLL